MIPGRRLTAFTRALLPLGAAQKPDAPVRTVESMRQLAAQLAEAGRVAAEAEAALPNAASGATRRLADRETSMLSDMHGRHHNYLRISLTERYVKGQ